MRVCFPVIAACLTGLCDTSARAEKSPRYNCPIPEQQRVAWSVNKRYDELGYGVAIGAHLALVGAPKADFHSSDAGAVLVYEFDGANWGVAQTLHAAQPRGSGHFGAALALSGNAALVGAPGASEVTFFRYRNGSWTIETTWRDGTALGDAVALDGTVAVIGDPRATRDNIQSGVAYVFRSVGNTWRLEAELQPPAPTPNQHFGDAVAVSGTTVAVGASQDDGHGQAAGAAYVFRCDGAGWVLERDLFAWDASCCVFFGEALGLSGDTVVAGARRAAGNEVLSGAAYVFRHDGTAWQPWTKLVGSDGRNFDDYGSAVSIAERTIVVGARRTDALGRRAGAAYVYRETDAEWIELGKLVPSDGDDGDYFGAVVSVLGPTALVGAPRAAGVGLKSGGAYIYTGLADCNVNAMLDACDIINATSPDNDGDGIPDECDQAGDLNCDGFVDHDDIRPFVLALGNPQRYAERFPNCFLANADINVDGRVDFGDIGPFVDLLSR